MNQTTPSENEELSTALDSLSEEELHSSTLTMLSLLQSTFAEDDPNFDELKRFLNGRASKLLFGARCAQIEGIDPLKVYRIDNHGRQWRYSGEVIESSSGKLIPHGFGQVTKSAHRKVCAW